MDKITEKKPVGERILRRSIPVQRSRQPFAATLSTNHKRPSRKKSVRETIVSAARVSIIKMMEYQQLKETVTIHFEVKQRIKF
jgi:hypothetical protein